MYLYCTMLLLGSEQKYTDYITVKNKYLTDLTFHIFLSRVGRDLESSRCDKCCWGQQGEAVSLFGLLGLCKMNWTS